MKLIENVINDTIEYKKYMQKLDKGLIAPVEIIEDKVITIPLEEYKELLVYKGKYLGLVGEFTTNKLYSDGNIMQCKVEE